MVDESLITDESQPNPQNQGNLLTSPGKRTVTGKMKTVESKTLRLCLCGSLLRENFVIQRCGYAEAAELITYC